MEISIVSDSCPSGHAAPAPAEMAILGKSIEGKAFVNLPLPDLAPVTSTLGNGAIKRQDVEAKAGYVLKNVLRPERSCPTYQIIDSIEVLDASRGRIRARRTLEHVGDAACSGKVARLSCRTELLATYTLSRVACESHCTANLRIDSGALDPQCTCVVQACETCSPARRQ